MKISPTEPLLIRRLGATSSYPERLGADVFWVANSRWYGVQRKEISDFVASVHDGRLAKEVAQMSRLHVRALILEGRWAWTVDGQWAGGGSRGRHGQTRQWDRFRQYQQEFSLLSAGVWVLHADTMAETADLIRDLERWSRKTSHSTATGRPGPSTTAMWGTPDSRDWWVWVAMGWPGVGPELAQRMVDHFGGRLPLRWEVDEAQMTKVPGIGPKRARQLLAIGGPTSPIPQTETQWTPAAG